MSHRVRIQATLRPQIPTNLQIKLQQLNRTQEDIHKVEDEEMVVNTEGVKGEDSTIANPMFHLLTAAHHHHKAKCNLNPKAPPTKIRRNATKPTRPQWIRDRFAVSVVSHPPYMSHHSARSRIRCHIWTSSSCAIATTNVQLQKE